MDYRKFNDKILVRLDRGDEIVEALTKVCLENQVEFATINGVGACSRAVLGYYNDNTRVFGKKIFEGEEYEITNLSGNASTCNKKPCIHLHMSLSGSDYNIVGGHLISATISITCEILLTLVGPVSKKYHEDIGAEIIEF